MRVAVVGGGASGLATAWLLDAHHHVTLFEAAPILGGHIRTLGGNVACAGLPPGTTLDAGVLEFDRAFSPCFHRLMHMLGVPVVDLDGGETGLFLARRHYLTPQKVLREYGMSPRAAAHLARLLPMVVRRWWFERRQCALDDSVLYALPVGSLLDDSDFGTWVRALLMYAYSTEYQRVDEIPAALAIPMLRQFLFARRWTRIPGGTYAYVERLVDDLRGDVRTGTPVQGIRRGTDDIKVATATGTETFDAVVIATPPGAVLDLLDPPTEDEARWFGPWQSDRITTLVHTDTGLYERRGVHYFSEFDLVQVPDGTLGYNAYLDRVCGVPEGVDEDYSLAFGLEAEVDAPLIVHRQEHVVPHYTVRAFRSRREIQARNGAGRVFFAGAWLGDGLHEGAITSAMAVGQRLGGRSL